MVGGVISESRRGWMTRQGLRLPLALAALMFGMIVGMPVSAQQGPALGLPRSLACNPGPVDSACAAELASLELLSDPFKGKIDPTIEVGNFLITARVMTALALARSGSWNNATAAIEHLPTLPQLGAWADLASLARSGNRPDIVRQASHALAAFASSPDAQRLRLAEVPYAYAVNAQIKLAAGERDAANASLNLAIAGVMNVANSDSVYAVSRTLIALHEVRGAEAALNALKTLRPEDGRLANAVNLAFALLQRGRMGEARAVGVVVQEWLSAETQKRARGGAISAEMWQANTLNGCLGALAGDLEPARNANDNYPPMTMANPGPNYRLGVYGVSTVQYGGVDSLRTVSTGCLALAHHKSGNAAQGQAVIRDLRTSDDRMRSDMYVLFNQERELTAVAGRVYRWAYLSHVWAAASVR
jgi:hypothetical protein